MRSQRRSFCAEPRSVRQRTARHTTGTWKWPEMRSQRRSLVSSYDRCARNTANQTTGTARRAKNQSCAAVAAILASTQGSFHFAGDVGCDTCRSQVVMAPLPDFICLLQTPVPPYLRSKPARSPKRAQGRSLQHRGRLNGSATIDMNRTIVVAQY